MIKPCERCTTHEANKTPYCDVCLVNVKHGYITINGERMQPVNIKEEVAELEADNKKRYDELPEDQKDSFKSYETVVTAYGNPVHRHIFIPALKKTYIKTADELWYLEPCTLCK